MREGNHVQMSAFGADHGYSDCNTLTVFLLGTFLVRVIQWNDARLARFRWFMQQETITDPANLDHIAMTQSPALGWDGFQVNPGTGNGFLIQQKIIPIAHHPNAGVQG